MTACRLLPFALSDGPGNMAADEVLLEATVGGVASFRLYGWTAPALSLGYFQREALRAADSLWAALPFVRRFTGGETLVHHFELTYALALPPGGDWQPLERPWLCRFHGIVRDALATLGVFVRACCVGEEKKLGGVLCFLHQTPGDLVLDGAKIAGSAQRKQRGALLQHGAILLAQSPHAPALAGLRELADFDWRRSDELQAALLDSFARQTGWRLEPGEWTEAERSRAAELAETKYRQASWNFKR